MGRGDKAGVEDILSMLAFTGCFFLFSFHRSWQFCIEMLS